MYVWLPLLLLCLNVSNHGALAFLVQKSGLSSTRSCKVVLLPRAKNCIRCNLKNDISGDGNEQNENLKDYIDLESSTNTQMAGTYLFLWVGFIIYAAFASPAGNTDLDKNLIMQMLTNPFDGKSNPFFVAVFNSLGVLPAVYACLLLPLSKRCKVPALPFVLSSFAAGYFALGPYLGLRQIRNLQNNADLTTSGISKQISLFENVTGSLTESKLLPVALLGFTTFLVYNVVLSANGDYQHLQGLLQEFGTLFFTQRLVNVSTIDFAILSLVVRILEYITSTYLHF